MTPRERILAIVNKEQVDRIPIDFWYTAEVLQDLFQYPIQHICPEMNTTDLKNKFGDNLVFHGGVDTQSVMPFGSTNEVKKEVNMLLDTLGRDKAGYICASCHNLQAGTPIENIITMIDTVLTR